MIDSNIFLYEGLLIAFGIIVPVGLAIWWVVTRKEKITTVLAGAATWFVFAVLLEAIPKYFFFNPDTALGQTVLGNVVLFSAIGALLAGIFEETGRLVVFKTLLRNRTNRETAISHGIGHGGFEAMFLLVSASISNLTYAAMINNGTFDTMVSQLEAQGIDVSSLATLPEQMASITLGYCLLTMVERIFAMLLHVGLSIVVFNSVRRSKISLFFLAVLLHALFDVPAALYQAGVLNLYVTEAVLVVYSVVFFGIVYKLFFKHNPVV